MEMSMPTEGTFMGKLVRDNIPEMIGASGRRPAVTVLGTEAFEVALRDKLAEEASEVRAAADRLEIRAELADVLEVVIALGACHGFTLNDLAKEANRRRDERGGFTNRLWLH
jgi:predicted house-cleaning noncanonical NTP pyrophosphatase (MazG superfamily)